MSVKLSTKKVRTLTKKHGCLCILIMSSLGTLLAMETKSPTAQENVTAESPVKRKLLMPFARAFGTHASPFQLVRPRENIRPPHINFKAVPALQTSTSHDIMVAVSKDPHGALPFSDYELVCGIPAPASPEIHWSKPTAYPWWFKYTVKRALQPCYLETEKYRYERSTFPLGSNAPIWRQEYAEETHDSIRGPLRRRPNQRPQKISRWTIYFVPCSSYTDIINR